MLGLSKQTSRPTQKYSNDHAGVIKTVTFQQHKSAMVIRLWRNGGMIPFPLVIIERKQTHTAMLFGLSIRTTSEATFFRC